MSLKSSILFKPLFHSSEVEEEGEKWYGCLIPSCLKNIECFSCKLPNCIKTFWDEFKSSEWGKLLKVIEEMDVTDGDWWKRIWKLIKGINGTRREWWLGLLVILLVLLPKAVKFLTLDVIFPGIDVYSDCDAANMHFK